MVSLAENRLLSPSKANTKRTGEGRFAILAGNIENYPGLIRQDLSRRLGGEIALTMPGKFQARLNELLASRAKAERTQLGLKAG